MATVQQEYHRKVGRVKAEFVKEQGNMGKARAIGEQSTGHVKKVQAEWAGFVARLGAAREYNKGVATAVGKLRQVYESYSQGVIALEGVHNDFSGALSGAAGHHKEQVVPAQGTVSGSHDDSTRVFNVTFGSDNHPAVRQTRQILGGLAEAVTAQTGFTAKLSDNYDTMVGDATRRAEMISNLRKSTESEVAIVDALGAGAGGRAEAYDNLVASSAAYSENAIGAQVSATSAVPGQYEAQMRATAAAGTAIDAYISTT